jgi:hypothetical protein
MMGDFGFDIELLIPLAEARPVLWDKMDDIYEDRNGTKKEDFEDVRDIKKRF